MEETFEHIETEEQKQQRKEKSRYEHGGDAAEQVVRLRLKDLKSLQD